jgi:hypothetical protein
MIWFIVLPQQSFAWQIYFTHFTLKLIFNILRFTFFFFNMSSLFEFFFVVLTFGFISEAEFPTFELCQYLLLQHIKNLKASKKGYSLFVSCHLIIIACKSNISKPLTEVFLEEIHRIRCLQESFYILYIAPELENQSYLLLGSTVQTMCKCVVGYIIKGGKHSDMQCSEFWIGSPGLEVFQQL